MNAHSTYLANFEFNEKWQGVKILKKLEDFMTTHNHTNFTLNGKKFAFLNQIPIFFYQKIQLEISYSMTKLDFKNILIWHV
jgi:hypothetical protein